MKDLHDRFLVREDQFQYIEDMFDRELYGIGRDRCPSEVLPFRLLQEKGENYVLLGCDNLGTYRFATFVHLCGDEYTVDMGDTFMRARLEMILESLEMKELGISEAA